MGKIMLTAAQSLPLDKLVVSSANVRRVKTGVSITELAEDIGRRGLLQSLNVRAVLDGAGAATGRYAVVAGGRRLAALHLLVKAKRLAKNAPVPCIVGAEGEASGVAAGEQKLHHARQDGAANGRVPEEDSLAENTMREALHPLDQFRAFQTLRDTHGMGDEDIAARCFVTPAVVRQRLRLAAVSPKLLDLYAEDGLSLDQLMAFTVTADHARQEAVWEALSRGHGREAYAIRRMLTAGAVRGSDKRAGFVGLEAYEAAGGTLERDLFEADGGGYLRDVALLDRLVDEKLAREANALRQEGWLWVEAMRDLPYGHVFGLRRLRAETVPLADEEQAERDRLVVEQEALETQYATSEDMPEAADQRLSEIETRLAELENRRQAFDAGEVVRAGAFVSIGTGGTLQVERGFVRPEDEPREPEPEAVPDIAIAEWPTTDCNTPALATSSMPTAATAEPETSLPPEDEDDGGRIPDRLMTELTAHRTLALRAALSADPDTASLVVLHALALWTFHGTDLDTCVEIDGRSAPSTPMLRGSAIRPRAAPWWTASSSGRGSCRAGRRTCGRRSSPSTPTAARHCWHSASGAASMRWCSPGIAGRGPLPMPTSWPGTSASTWRPMALGRRPWNAISAASARPASSMPSATPGASAPRKASRTSERPRWRRPPNGCSPAPAGCPGRCAPPDGTRQRQAAE